MCAPRTGAAGVSLTVWFNPMFEDTGFVGNSTDAERIPTPLPPRLSLTHTPALVPGGVAVVALTNATRVDYISVLPASVV